MTLKEELRCTVWWLLPHADIQCSAAACTRASVEVRLDSAISSPVMVSSSAAKNNSSSCFPCYLLCMLIEGHRLAHLHAKVGRRLREGKPIVMSLDFSLSVCAPVLKVESRADSLLDIET